MRRRIVIFEKSCICGIVSSSYTSMSVHIGYNVSMTTTKSQSIAILDKFRRPLRDLRISVTDRCNFRCTYCMPAEIFGERYEFLQKADLLTFEEIARLTRVFAELGVVKVRLTGGEPLVRAEIEKLVAMLADIEGIGDLTMTTNAYLLPQKATTLRNAGLQRLTVSLDTLDDAIFREMNGRGFGVARVLEGIAAAEDAGFSPIKVNSVVQKGVNDHTLVDLARYFRERGPHHALHRVHGCGQPQRLEARRSRIRRGNRRAHRR